MQKRHTDRELYFSEQVYTTERYILPFIGQGSYVGLRVLEIGSGEGGNLVPFADAGAQCVGIDLSAAKIEAGRQVLADRGFTDRITLVCRDIFEVSEADFGRFDIILMKDVIEHIPGQTEFLSNLRRFMSPGCRVVIAYPPYLNPFAGHQQVCRHRLLSKLPFVYLLPDAIYRGIMQRAGEAQGTIDELVDLKRTGLTIERLEKDIVRAGLKIAVRQHYLINPNYQVKFGLPPVKQFPVLRSLPWIRNFYTTASFYILTQ